MNKKGQVVLEVLVVVSILIIGLILFGLFYLRQQTISFEQAELPGQDVLQSPVDYSEVTVPSRIACGNFICEEGENLTNCPGDCSCGNVVCDASENCNSCPSDCGACPPEMVCELGLVTFNPPSGNILITDPISLSYNNTNPDCKNIKIRYTTDNSEPTESSPEYVTTPVSLLPLAPSPISDFEIKVKAKAFADSEHGPSVIGPITTEIYNVAIPYCFEGMSRGDGTPTHPKEICSAANLDDIDSHLDWYYVLGVDVDLGVYPYNSGNGWPPIGYINNSAHPQYQEFTGNFNGNNHTIYNLYIQRPDSCDYQGLFSAIGPGATISNLHLVNVNLDGIQTYIGSLVGRNNGGTVNNCSATAVQIVAHKEYVGGLVGYLENSGVISNCYTQANISSSKDYVGGIVGYSDSGTIINNYSKGQIYSSKKNLGGLIGRSVNSNISNNYVVGRVSGGSGNMGCFMGSTMGGTIIGNYYNNVICTIVSTPISGVLGKSTADQKLQETYLNWDFTNTWNINSTNEGYPHLITNPSN